MRHKAGCQFAEYADEIERTAEQLARVPVLGDRKSADELRARAIAIRADCGCAGLDQRRGPQAPVEPAASRPAGSAKRT